MEEPRSKDHQSSTPKKRIILVNFLGVQTVFAPDQKTLHLSRLILHEQEIKSSLTADWPEKASSYYLLSHRNNLPDNNTHHNYFPD